MLSSARYRLKADASGNDNLLLCSDWIDFGMNVGYVEGAVTSGLQAAQALRRRLGLPSPGFGWEEVAEPGVSVPDVVAPGYQGDMQAE